MLHCGVYAYDTSKTPDSTVYHSYIYIIETHNFDSTMNKKITNRVSQSLDSYLVEIGKHSLQTVEEQTELAHRIKRGDEEALSELIAGDLRFVVSVAKQYQNRSKSMEELIEAGNKGLALAAKKFDPQLVSNSLLMPYGSSGRAFLLSLKLQRTIQIFQFSQKKRNVS